MMQAAEPQAPMATGPPLSTKASHQRRARRVGGASGGGPKLGLTVTPAGAPRHLQAAFLSLP